MSLKKISRNSIAWKIYEFVRNVAIKFHKDRCLIRSSGLAYSSLLALVPLSAIVFSLLSAFGVFSNLIETIQYHIVEQLLPVRQDEIINYIDRFVDNTKALGIAGLLLFVFTSVLLISNIQKNFNDIWKIHKRRSFINQFSTYTTVIVMGTLLLGAGFALSGWIESFVKSLPDSNFRYFLELLFSLLPAMTFFFSILLLIMAVPSVRVKIKGAVIGVLSGYILIWILKVIFITFSNAAIRYSIIYGSLALIPIFLLWLYILWAIILLSTEITYVYQVKWKPDFKTGGRISLYDEFMLRLEVFMFIAEVHHKGIKPPDAEIIAEKFKLSLSKADNILVYLERSGIIYMVAHGKQGYMPSKSISAMSLKDAASSITGYKKTVSRNNSGSSVGGSIEAILDQYRDVTIHKMLEDQNRI